MKKYFFIVFIVFYSCATQYNSLGLRGGYSDLKVDSDTYEVKFIGNGLTSQSLIEKYFLFRCSEITLENGKKYFIFYDKNIGSVKVKTNINGDIDDNGNFSATTNNINNAFGKGTIKLYESRPENFDGVIYDAEEITKSLKPYIKQGKNSLF
jgi:hypothetical protein